MFTKALLGFTFITAFMTSALAGPCDTLDAQHCYDLMMLQKLAAAESAEAQAEAMAAQREREWHQYFAAYIGADAPREK